MIINCLIYLFIFIWIDFNDIYHHLGMTEQSLSPKFSWINAKKK